MASSFKGILYPARLPTFHRLPAPENLKDLVQWFWIPEWDIEPGRTSRQQLLAFPACNLVVQPNLMELAGPTTCASHQDLTDRGWAVGALLQPAAVPFFTNEPATLRDTRKILHEPELCRRVSHAMDKADSAPSRDPAKQVDSAMPQDPAGRLEQAAAELGAWLSCRIPAVTREGLLANSMAALIGSRADVVGIQGAAELLAVSTRTLQRLARKYVGLSPSALIRRRRLQEAADQARMHPELDLASIAAHFGYADQAHLANDFQRVLGFTPGSYRRSVLQDPSPSPLRGPSPLPSQDPLRGPSPLPSQDPLRGRF